MERRLTREESFRRTTIRTLTIGGVLLGSSLFATAIGRCEDPNTINITPPNQRREDNPSALHTEIIPPHRTNVFVIPTDKAGDRDFQETMRSREKGLPRLLAEAYDFLGNLK